MLNKISCPHCNSFANIVIELDFKNRTSSGAYCVKRRIKPHLVRKFGKIVNTGCGKSFKIAIRLKKKLDNEESQLCQKS